MIHLKLDYLHLLYNMFSSYSRLYLFDINHYPDSEFSSDFLLIHEIEDKILHLGLVKAHGKEKGLCHRNSFITTYMAEKEYDILYRVLTHCYEISKIIREEKETKVTETIYQSGQAALREKTGIEPEPNLVRYIMKINVKFGKYHTIEMLSKVSLLMVECRNKRDKILVEEFIVLWRNRQITYQ